MLLSTLSMCHCNECVQFYKTDSIQTDNRLRSIILKPIGIDEGIHFNSIRSDLNLQFARNLFSMDYRPLLMMNNWFSLVRFKCEK